jgi:Ca-activated chloride channel family protein
MDPQGHLTEGLTKSAFTVYENDSPQEISFFSDDDAPASVAIVFDTSGSMTEEKILCAREALASFISTSHGKDEFFLISFSSTAQPLLDKTRDSDALLDKLTYVQPSGNTALYDAVYLGLEKLAGAVYQKRALLIISDGQDNHSRYTAGEVRQRLAESGVLTYSVGVSTSYLRPTSQEIVGVDVLKRLARVSGGRAYFPSNAEEMSEAFERISIELRRQYSIGYRPSNVPVNGEWRRVKVAVATPASNGKRLVVRSREGYYAPVDRH